MSSITGDLVNSESVANFLEKICDTIVETEMRPGINSAEIGDGFFNETG